MKPIEHPASPSAPPTGSAASNKFEKSDNPYDVGYWLRYDGQPMPKHGDARKGWEACDKELMPEAEAQHNGSSSPTAADGNGGAERKH